MCKGLIKRVLERFIHSTSMNLHITLDRNMNPKTACLGKRRNPEEIGKIKSARKFLQGP